METEACSDLENEGLLAGIDDELDRVSSEWLYLHKTRNYALGPQCLEELNELLEFRLHVRELVMRRRSFLLAGEVGWD